MQMTDLPWLGEYSGERTGELLALERTYRKDSIIAVFQEALLKKWHRVEDFYLLSAEERAILSVIDLENEVCNGGYEQYFVNTFSEFVAGVVAALTFMGLNDVAVITQRAIDTVAAHGGVKEGELESACEEALEACTAEYFEFPRDLTEPVFEFIRQNQERIKLF